MTFAKRDVRLINLALGASVAIFGFVTAEVAPLAESERIVRIVDTVSRDDLYGEIGIELGRLSSKTG